MNKIREELERIAATNEKDETLNKIEDYINELLNKVKPKRTQFTNAIFSSCIDEIENNIKNLKGE